MATSDLNPTVGSSVPRNLLVVPYFYPPFPGSGHRWPTIARYLRRAGHNVTVLATGAFGTLENDDELGVIRVPDLRSVHVVRKVLRRGELPVAGDTAYSSSPPGWLLTKVVVPDALAVSWLPAALVRARRILSRSSVDCLVTSGPPDSAHLLGLLLGRGRPAWIADFRDGWCFEPLREPFPTSAQRALDGYLERKVVRSAEVAVGATLPIAEDLEVRLGARAAYVPNAWDPELKAGTSSSVESRGPVRVVYTGAFSGIRGSDPGPFLRALRIASDHAGDRAFKLVLAGQLTRADRELILETATSELVESVGILRRPEALSLQRSADALLLLTSRNSSEATGKLYEYLGARRPILALAEGNEAARIVQETHTGVTVPPDDVPAITAALRRVAAGDLGGEYAPRNLEQYTYPAPAERFAELVEDAIRRRGATTVSD